MSPPTADDKSPETSDARTNNRLSTISKKYDGNNKGYLDETEKAMRDLDQSNRGFLTNDKVYAMLVENNKKMVTQRKLTIGLCVFAVLLALANIGTSFAAARLAKDTTVDSTTGAMKTMNGDTLVGTKPTIAFKLFVEETSNGNGGTNKCVDVQELAKAYKEVHNGSPVNMIDNEGGDGEAITTISEVSRRENALCIGKACFALDKSCDEDHVHENEGDSTRRRQMMASENQETFRRIMVGETPSLRSRALWGHKVPCASCDQMRCAGDCVNRGQCGRCV